MSQYSIALLTYYVTVVEDRPIVCRISSATFGHNGPTLQRGLSAIAKLLVNNTIIRLKYANCSVTHAAEVSAVRPSQLR